MRMICDQLGRVHESIRAALKANGMKHKNYATAMKMLRSGIWHEVGHNPNNYNAAMLVKQAQPAPAPVAPAPVAPDSQAQELARLREQVARLVRMWEPAEPAQPVPVMPTYQMSLWPASHMVI